MSEGLNAAPVLMRTMTMTIVLNIGGPPFQKQGCAKAALGSVTAITE